MSFRPAFLLTLCSILALGACSPLGNEAATGGTGTRADTAEDILSAEGSWAMVDTTTAANSPMDLHSSARKQVDPNNPAKRNYVTAADEMTNVGGTAGDADVNFRLIRIERDVADLRQDFDKLLPPLSNLIVSDNQLNKTIEEIQARPERKPDAPPQKVAAAAQPQRYVKEQEKPIADVLQRTTGTPATEPAPTTSLAQLQPPVPSSGASAATPPAPLANAPAPASSGSTGAMVSNLRTGEHPGKTRLVLDLTSASSYKADIDNNEKLLLIELGNAGWSAAQQKALNNPLIKGYTTQQTANGGTILALELKKPVKILGSSALKPNGQTGHRIYFDLAAS